MTFSFESVWQTESDDRLMAKFPARIHVLLARDAPVGLVIRRGPSKSVCPLSWDQEYTKAGLRQAGLFRSRSYEAGDRSLNHAGVSAGGLFRARSRTPLKCTGIRIYNARPNGCARPATWSRSLSATSFG